MQEFRQLIALQYHEVKIELEFRPKAECYVSTAGSLNSCGVSVNGTLDAFCVPSLEYATLFIDYIYLDTDERRRFAQTSHEYLIEQLQFTGDESTVNTNVKVKLNLNHPVKELIWVARLIDAEAECQWANFTTGVVGSEAYAGANPLVDAKLQLNGHDRFSTRGARYFNLVQPYQHHTRNPDTGINVYSFALRPEEHQPSGTCNFSRIDNATLQLVLSNATVAGTNTAKVRVYATNYNVLRVMSGIKACAEQLAAILDICLLIWINSVKQICVYNYVNTLCNQLVSL